MDRYLIIGTSGTIYGCSSDPIIDKSGVIACFCDCTGNYLPLCCIQNCTQVPEEIRLMYNCHHEFNAGITTTTSMNDSGNISRDIISQSHITTLAEQEAVGSEGIIILPYFSLGGERTPNWPHASGGMFGLRTGG